MPIPDFILLIIFGTVALVTFACSLWCFRQALRAAPLKDGDLKMFFWAVGSMCCLVISGMSTAYILFPILFG